MIKRNIKSLLGRFGLKIEYKKHSLPKPYPLLSEFSTDWHPLLRRSKISVERLLAVPNTKLWQERDKIYCEVEDITFEIETHEDLFIMSEVFYDGDYNFSCSKPYVVMDIGMNIGITSLFFARKPEVLSVYAYEPVEPTRRQAQKNLAGNLPWSGKITSHPYGLSDRNSTQEIAYTYEWKGSLGVNELSDFKKQAADIGRITIELKDVAPEVKKIKANHPGSPLVIKIDCEGSEYAIINRLAEENMLREASVFMIEWHKDGPEYLSSLLAERGFTLLSRTPFTRSIGMLYAFAT